MKRNRKSIRLKGWDYSSSGFYFVTICVKNRESLFGRIENEKMILNDAGLMVERCWLEIFERFKNAKINNYVVMPNHFHTILEVDSKKGIGQPQGIAPTNMIEGVNDIDSINIENGQPQGIVPTNIIEEVSDIDSVNPVDVPLVGTSKQITVGDIIGAFKSISTNEYIRGVRKYNWQSFDKKLWQRNYCEHIIRNQKSYDRIFRYIEVNPARWANDFYS